MGRNPEPDDGSIYTLRRRIPTRPTAEHEGEVDQEASVQRPVRLSAAPATWPNSLINRLLPTVRLGH
jgi:hypothetical protein